MSKICNRQLSRKCSALLAATALILSACGSHSNGTGSGGEERGDLREASLQLNWITNATWAGSYLAEENGHYENEGLDLEILPGGPNVDFMATLSSGQADIAFAGMTEPMTLNENGADFRVVGTMYQKNPISIVSLEENNINRPEDLEGRRLGVGDSAISVWEQFADHVGIDKDSVEVVTIQSGQSELVSGDVDAMMGYVTEAPVALELRGLDPSYFLLQDFGFGYYVDVYAVRNQDLEDPEKRETIKRILKADLEGQLDMIKDPEGAAQITVDRYGDDLGLEYDAELATAKAAADLFYSDTTREHGIGYMGGEELEITMSTMNAILGSDYPLDGEGIIVNDLLDEIHDENPNWGVLPD